MLVVSLLTRGSPQQLTGGHLYHRRLAEAAPVRDSRIDFVSVSCLRNPIGGVGDVVVVDSLAATAVAPWAVAARRLGCPLAAIIHQPPGGVGQHAVRTAVQRTMDLMLYRRCDLLVAVSPAVADELVERAGLPRERICVAQPGRDVPADSSPAADMRLGRRAAVLCVANWHPNKGIVELLDSIAELPPGLATLHLVGRTDVDESYSVRVRDRLAGPDLAGRVVVHGAVDPHELGGLYAGADVFALASFSETYGTVYAEALAAGLPVVGWRSGNLPNLMDDGIEGCLIDPGDVVALSAAFQRLATDESWRATLATSARRRGEALPTWDDTADTVFGALTRLVTARG